MTEKARADSLAAVHAWMEDSLERELREMRDIAQLEKTAELKERNELIRRRLYMELKAWMRPTVAKQMVERVMAP